MRWLLDLLSFKNGSRHDLVDATEQAIERVIDGTEPRLRLVPGYKNKLRKDVAGALAFIDQTVEQIPGPLDMQRNNYVHNPEVAAYFSTPDEITRVFSTSPELKSFFESTHHIEADTAYAMMCVQREEKQIMGMEVAGAGDHIRRDVLQTAVNFHDHKILSAAESEEQVRAAIKQCIFDGLITYALNHLSRLKIERKELEDERRILQSRLRARQARGNGLSKLLVQAYHDNLEQISQLEAHLSEAEHKLELLPGHHELFESYLEEVRTIFSNPEDFIHMHLACFRLNDMGIKLDDEAASSGNTLCFSELEIAGVLKRVVTLVRLPRSELI